MEKLIEILKASSCGTGVDFVPTLNKDECVAKCGDLKVEIEPIDEEVFPDWKDKNIYNVLIYKDIKPIDADIEFSDVEKMIAKANWFISDDYIKVITLDMPDGTNVSMTLQVL